MLLGVDYLYRKTIQITIEQRKKNSFMGRFGGGWHYELGLQVGNSDLIINLLVLSIRIHIGGVK